MEGEGSIHSFFFAKPLIAVFGNERIDHISDRLRHCEKKDEEPPWASQMPENLNGCS